MFFTDGNDVGAGVDPGPSGFLNLFSESASTDAPTETPTDTTPDADSQAGATAADTSSPEGTDDGQYTDADDVVAARFAASLEDDGIEIPEPGDEDAEDEPDAPTEGEVDFESLTDEQKRTMLEELKALKAERSQTDDQTRQAAVRQKVEEAEANAAALVGQQFETDVLTKSRNHYAAQLNQRVAGIVRAAKNQDDPDTYITQQTLAAAHAVFEARAEWEAQQAQDWGKHVDEARLQARQNVPELREYVAAHVAAKFNLPPQAIADIADPQRHITAFEKRAEELAGLAGALGKERKKSDQQKRTDANRKLQEQPIRTSPTGRQPGGKPPAYKGTADEGMRILSLMRSG